MTDLFGAVRNLKTTISRQDLEQILLMNLKDVSLEELVSLFTNKFIEIIEYINLLQGENTCQRMSLLFNPHRLDVKTKSSKLSILQALKTDNFISGLSRAILFKKDQYAVGTLLYQTMELGINGVQYVNEFPPYVARDLCQKFSLDKDSKVLDPCAGWGGRMIGVSAVSNYYCGFEPSTKTYSGLLKLDEFLRSMNADFKSTLHCLPFEESELDDNTFDFAVTSPPYYDTEEYCTEETNSFNRYTTFDSWCEHFYLPMIEKTMNSLKHGSYFVLNIGSRKYALNNVLITNFKDTYQITKSGMAVLGSGTGLKNSDLEGESFYLIRKS